MSALLTNCLMEDLDPVLVAKLDSNETLKQEAMAYLDRVLVKEQLFSTEPFAFSVATPGKTTLTEEIAELDLRGRQLEEQLAKVTNSNRDLIISVSQDLKTVDEKFGLPLDSEINSILTNINNLHINNKWDTTTKGTERFTVSNSVLFDIDPILDVLELPTLCKFCISQGNYQEALEVSIMVKMLIIKFPTLKTFQKIEEKIKIELQIMVKGLINLLNTNLKQSNILKVFQILNQLYLIDLAGRSSSITNKDSIINNNDQEQFLKIIYFNSRFKFITSELSSLKPLLKMKKMTYLRRCIETCREHLSISLSIYRAIFHSASHVNAEREDGVLAHSFVKTLVKSLLAEIRQHFKGIASISNDKNEESEEGERRGEELEEGSEIKGQMDGVILQLVYLCKSLDKYGLNFESMLTWELCLVEPVLVCQEDWSRNLTKVKKLCA